MRERKLFHVQYAHSSSDKTPTHNVTIAARTLRQALEHAEKIAKKRWHDRIVTLDENIGHIVEVA